MLGKKHSEETKKRIGKWGKGKKHTQNSKDKISLSKKGERNYFWKGGLTDLNKRIRNSREYKNWRKEVFERDDYRCVLCGKRGIYIQADHIKPFALFQELRFVLDNGRTLCVDCHRQTDTFGKHKKNDQTNLAI